MTLRNAAKNIVHYPVHLHPYYQEKFECEASSFPNATTEWERLISLPIFPSMRDDEVQHVIGIIKKLCLQHSKTKKAFVAAPAGLAVEQLSHVLPAGGGLE
jgi:dTDP-4-amino-4,6-dideoxygalactose transaminase